METALSIVIINNLLMSGVKWLGGQSLTTGWLRASLGFFSLMGLLATAALSGSPVDLSQVSSLSWLIFEAVGISLASHFSYKAIKNA